MLLSLVTTLGAPLNAAGAAVAAVLAFLVGVVATHPVGVALATLYGYGALRISIVVGRAAGREMPPAE